MTLAPSVLRRLANPLFVDLSQLDSIVLVIRTGQLSWFTTSFQRRNKISVRLYFSNAVHMESNQLEEKGAEVYWLRGQRDAIV